MRKKLTFVFSLLIVCSIAITQTKETIDSLQHQFATANDDRSRINIQIWLCAVYRLGNTDSSLFYGQEALKASQQINYPTGEILASSFMAITLEQMGDLPKALEMAFKALQLAKSNKLESMTSPALNAIGEVYIILKDYPKALNYLQKQRSISQDEGNIEGLAYALSDIGLVYEEMNQLDSAIYYVQQAIEVFRKINRDEPFVYKTMGDIKLKSGNRGEALNFYQKSLQIATNNNERRASALAYNKIAFFYKNNNQPDSGIYYALNAIKESELISQKKTIMEAAILLSEFYEQTNTKEAFRYLKIADAYKDSLFGAGNLQAIQALVTKEEEHQKEIEDAKVKYQSKLKQYALIAGLGILLLVASILYRNNRHKQKANIVLRQQKEEIQTTLSQLKSTQSQLIQSEKMASLGELAAGIAHEIQNPLNFVNNFSEVNKELLTEMNEEIEKGNLAEVKVIAKNVIDNQQKINHHGKRADAIVKGMLQHSRTSTGQKEPTDINALADEYLRLAYHGFRAKDKSFNADIKTDFDNSIGKINIIPQDIGRVVLNLISNAFYVVDEKKKSMPPSPKGEEGAASFDYEPVVTVKTKRLGPPLGDRGKIEIRVADNGNGIPQKVLDKIFQPFFTTKPTGQGTGLGLSLSYDIVKAHGGELKVETKEGQGSEFIIFLPLT
jgi:signal transduction histidine kinase